MKLEKAIEILTDEVSSHKITTHSDLKDAQKLGIEALNRIQACRKVIDIPYNKPLPSETEE